MKKLFAVLLSTVMAVSVLAGCAKVKDAAQNAVQNAITQSVEDAASSGADSNSAKKNDTAQNNNGSDTASAFISDYFDAKSAVVNKIMDGLSNNPDTMMTALSFLGASMSDLYLLPAMYFGLGESSVATALAMMGAKDVTYDEQGNNYTVSYKNADGQDYKMTGTYDKGRSLVAVGSTNDIENVFAQTYRTSFGYVSQFYSVADDGTSTLYLFSIYGEDGVIGISTGKEKPASLTGNEAADFAKSSTEWYAIDGSTITGLDSNGNAINFEYVPTESNG